MNDSAIDPASTGPAQTDTAEILERLTEGDIDPFVRRASQDVGFPFEAGSLAALIVLCEQKKNLPDFQRLKTRLKAETDVSVSALVAAMKATARAAGMSARTGADGREVIPSPGEPMRVAQLFVEQRHMRPDGATLAYWQGSWWVWRTVRWREVAHRQVIGWLYRFTAEAAYEGDGGELKSWSPTHRKIADLLEALGAICLFPDDLEQPCWLDGRASGLIVALDNGLLELREGGERRLLPHTPMFFNQTAVPFAYDPDAPPPKLWLKFLGELWPSLDANGAPEEWFGYVVSGRLDQHKILLIIGPTRGGKGVIARILTVLVGKDNIAGPTLNSLGGDFGLAPLIGKSLAIVSDARFGFKDDSVVVERLLSISGEDALTVNRKYQQQWTGRLSCLLHIMSNELPRLRARPGIAESDLTGDSRACVVCVA
jgi:putative DNA primase/helicase